MTKKFLSLCFPTKKPQPAVEPEPEVGSTEYWNEIHKERQEKKARNRKSSPEILRQAGIMFESRNQGAHLIVHHGGTYIDFWPGTGLWIPLTTRRKHRGVNNLIAYVKGERK